MLDLPIVVSKIQQRVVCFLWMVFGAIILTLPLMYCLPLVLLLSLYVYLFLKKPLNYVRLFSQEDATLLLEDRHGQLSSVVIESDTVVYPFLILLSIKHAKKERILLWSDSSDVTLLRELRVWLWWQWRKEGE